MTLWARKTLIEDRSASVTPPPKMPDGGEQLETFIARAVSSHVAGAQRLPTLPLAPEGLLLVVLLHLLPLVASGQ